MESGHRLHGFRVLDCVHSGAMAQIYRVEYDPDMTHGRTDPGFPMVMKIPRMKHADGAENLIGFEIEQQILPTLSGPFTPRFVAAGDLDHLPYLVMEYIQGTTLEDLLEDPQYTNPEAIARLGAAMGKAVHSLHQQNVCHLDLKPANVLFRSVNGMVDIDQAVVLDFGLSCHAHFPDLMAEELRKAVGSPAWISPEQIVGVRGDPRSDVFAIGVMLYQLCTGELPFGAPSTQGGLRQRLWMDPVPPKRRRADTPDWLQEVILKCLEPEADRRYPTAAHLALDLQNPEQVRITARGRQIETTSFWTHFKRWVRAAGMHYQPSPLPQQQVQSVPIVMVAIPAHGAEDAAMYSLRESVQRSMGIRPGARLAVVTVVGSSIISNTHSGKSETGLHQHYLNVLRQWAAPLTLGAGQVSFHVLESNDVAKALLAYATGNHVSLIVMGAATRGLQMQKLVATIPIKVAMHAPCSVMLVKQQLPFEHLADYEPPPDDPTGDEDAGMDVFKTW
ncbi:MAG TPA: bifunctional serine/threonine-protein kinase/universal stress protein [Limnobacter sp.]|nr:bifunctional serine/threonine-protein kinase/universal stress protein [Limnobacter sp.]